MKNLNDTIVHTQLFFTNTVHNWVSNDSHSTRWPIASFTKTSFVFINIFLETLQLSRLFDDMALFLGDMISSLWSCSLCFSCLAVFNWVSILLCMGVLLQELDSSIQTEQSLSHIFWKKDVLEMSLMFHAFSSMLLSFWVLYINKFWMISFLEIFFFPRNSISFSRFTYDRFIY